MRANGSGGSVQGGVDLALRQAEVLHDQARKAGDDLGRWIEARDAARSVELLGDDARDEATQLRVAEFVRNVKSDAAAAENDRTLLDGLIDIRSAKEDDDDGSITDADYAEAFRKDGIDVAALPPAEAGARIKARPPRSPPRWPRHWMIGRWCGAIAGKIELALIASSRRLVWPIRTPGAINSAIWSAPPRPSSGSKPYGRWPCRRDRKASPGEPQSPGRGLARSR